jgi:hypothetical protein
MLKAMATPNPNPNNGTNHNWKIQCIIQIGSVVVDNNNHRKYYFKNSTSNLYIAAHANLLFGIW